MTKLDMMNKEGLTVWLQVHDENVLCVPADEAEAALKRANEIMCEPLPWWPELPLGSEGAIGNNYLEAK